MRSFFSGKVVSPWPSSPPPTHIPQMPRGPYHVSPAMLERALYHNLYIWQKNGDNFWMYPNTTGATSLEGYRWQGGRWHRASVPYTDILYYYA